MNKSINSNRPSLFVERGAHACTHALGAAVVAEGGDGDVDGGVVPLPRVRHGGIPVDCRSNGERQSIYLESIEIDCVESATYGLKTYGRGSSWWISSSNSCQAPPSHTCTNEKKCETDSGNRSSSRLVIRFDLIRLIAQTHTYTTQTHIAPLRADSPVASPASVRRPPPAGRRPAAPGWLRPQFPAAAAAAVVAAGRSYSCSCCCRRPSFAPLSCGVIGYGIRNQCSVPCV